MTEIGGKAVDLQDGRVAGRAHRRGEQTNMTGTIEREIRRHRLSPTAGKWIATRAGVSLFVLRANADFPQSFICNRVAGRTELVVAGLVFRRQPIGVKTSTTVGRVKDVLANCAGKPRIVTRKRGQCRHGVEGIHREAVPAAVGRATNNPANVIVAPASGDQSPAASFLCARLFDGVRRQKLFRLGERQRTACAVGVHAPIQHPLHVVVCILFGVHAGRERRAEGQQDLIIWIVPGLLDRIHAFPGRFEVTPISEACVRHVFDVCQPSDRFSLDMHAVVNWPTRLEIEAGEPLARSQRRRHLGQVVGRLPDENVEAGVARIAVLQPTCEHVAHQEIPERALGVRSGGRRRDVEKDTRPTTLGGTEILLTCERSRTRPGSACRCPQGWRRPQQQCN